MSKELDMTDEEIEKIADAVLKKLRVEEFRLKQAFPNSPPMGCVCPIGAEVNCHNGLCQRRGVPGLSPIWAYGAGHISSSLT